MNCFHCDKDEAVNGFALKFSENMLKKDCYLVILPCKDHAGEVSLNMCLDCLIHFLRMHINSIDELEDESKSSELH